MIAVVHDRYGSPERQELREIARPSYVSRDSAGPPCLAFHGFEPSIRRVGAAPDAGH